MGVYEGEIRSFVAASLWGEWAADACGREKPETVPDRRKQQNANKEASLRRREENSVIDVLDDIMVEEIMYEMDATSYAYELRMTLVVRS